LTAAGCCTAAVATMEFAMSDIVADFLVRYPKVNVVAHATDQLGQRTSILAPMDGAGGEFQ